MNLALNGIAWIDCLVYLDDIVIWSSTFDDHLRRLRDIFGKMRAAKVKFKKKNCSLLKQIIEFLGQYAVSEKGIQTDPDKKIKALQEWLSPNKVFWDWVRITEDSSIILHLSLSHCVACFRKVSNLNGYNSSRTDFKYVSKDGCTDLVNIANFRRWNDRNLYPLSRSNFGQMSRVRFKVNFQNKVDLL